MSKNACLKVTLKPDKSLLSRIPVICQNPCLPASKQNKMNGYLVSDGKLPSTSHIFQTAESHQPFAPGIGPTFQLSGKLQYDLKPYYQVGSLAYALKACVFFHFHLIQLSGQRNQFFFLLETCKTFLISLNDSPGFSFLSRSVICEKQVPLPADDNGRSVVIILSLLSPGEKGPCPKFRITGLHNTLLLRLLTVP